MFKRELSQLRACLNRAVRDRKLTSNPLAITLLDEENQRTYVLPPEEELRLYRATDTRDLRHLRDTMILARYTGMREEERSE